ncbi:MAG: tRNA 2-thiouridine(34) synthase MnmA [Planctomycetaceae bacterium]|nr:tRNA 2-thiouridine(34) synthase MnmA [Planctomycetaceae bacterium]
MARVVLAMSGGVDSSVAAHLLLEQGHEVIGVFMRHGQASPVACAIDEPTASQVVPTPAHVDSSGAKTKRAGGETPRLATLPIINRLDHKQGCCTASDAEDARRVADRLAIPFYALNLDQEFSRIIDYFVDEYAAGRTPNPCVQCNNWIKFGKLFDYADSVDAEFVATGHYARMATAANGDATLLRGRDDSKDQSYVLFGIKQRFLKRMLLPVGDYEKSEIRRLAAGVGLNVAMKKDSQEICFVTQGHYHEFIKDRQARRGDLIAGETIGGEFVLTSGEVVGQHDGIEGFTIGQRKGLGIAFGDRKFVVRIEPETRRVVLGDREELGRGKLTAQDCNWLIDPSMLPTRGLAQIRYNATPAWAEFDLDADGRLHVQFDEPRYGVAPGQAVVCYDGERVLGGGWIE